MKTAIAVVLALSLASAARADLDVVIGNGDVVRGTLLPATERETFRVTCPPGAVLAVAAQSGRAKAELAVRVLDPDGSTIASRGARRVKLAGVIASAGGEYRVVVTTADGATSDDYSLAVSWRSPAKATSTVRLGGSSSATFDFVADAGARVALNLAPAKGSAAKPSLVRVANPDASTTGLKAGRAAVFAAPTTGTYTATFENKAAVAGDVKARAIIVAPRPTKRRLAATTREIPAGAQVVAAAVMDARGGRLDAPAGARRSRPWERRVRRWSCPRARSPSRRSSCSRRCRT